MPLRFSVLMLFTGLCFAQTADRDRHWVQDADWMAQQIIAIHPNPFSVNSRERFQAELESLKADIPRLKDYEVIARLARLAALAGDGHTSLSIMNGSRGAGVQVRWFSDGLWITAGGPATGQLIGRRVVAVNGVPIEEIFTKLKPYLSHENESWARQISTGPILSPEVLSVLGVLPAPSAVPVTLEDRRGERSEALLPAGGAVTIPGPHLAFPLNPLWRRNGTFNYWAHFLEESRTLYVKYNSCSESPALKMTDFARELAALATEKQPVRVVFDLRDNTGGDSNWLNVMLRDLQIAYATGQLALPSAGMAAIISKTTFSSGTLGAMLLRGFGAVTVGEASGGNPTGFGPTVAITLPNSGIVMSCSRGWIQTEGWGQAPVPAEIEVAFPAAAYFADQDPYLEAALKVDRPLTPPESATLLRRSSEGR